MTKRRMILSAGSVRTIPAIPDEMIALVKIPHAQLSPVNRVRVRVYESILKYQLFTSGDRLWDSACKYPQERVEIWRRCERCGLVITPSSAGFFTSCYRCETKRLTLSMWGV